MAAEAAAGSIQARLTRKMGPLPVWAWAAVIVGAYIAYTHFHGKTASGSSQPDTSQGAQAAGPIDTGAGAGGSAGAGGPMDNMTQDQLSALEASVGGLTATVGSLQTTLASTNFSATNTAQSTGGGTSSGSTLIAPPPPGTHYFDPPGLILEPVPKTYPGAVSPSGWTPMPAPQTKIGQTLSAAGVGGNPGSAGFVTPITVPSVMNTFAITSRAPTSKLAPSGTAVHKAVAV